jgi:flagellar assembly factor FliW
VEFPTKQFGVIHIREDQVINFPEGLIGFQSCKRFFVFDLDEFGVFKWLQNLDDESLGFVILDPRLLFKDYDPEFVARDLEILEASSPGDLVLLSVVTLPEEVRDMTVNLQAPLVINPSKRLGRQVITISQEYSTKHNVFVHVKNLMKRTG